MKNKLKYIILLFSSVWILGCSEDFLNQDLPASYKPDEIFKREVTALLTVSGVYNAMAELYVNQDYADREHYTDNASSYANDQWIVINETYPFSSGLWSRAYTMISRANLAIEGISKMDDKLFSSVAVKNRSIGECLSIKALAYHELVFRFGDVPYYSNQPFTVETMNIPRTPKAVVLDSIIANLDKAIEYLPSHNTYKGTSNLGRISKEAALAIKARILLFYADDPADYLAAANAAKQIINPAAPLTRAFDLEDDYLKCFVKTGNNHKESVLVIGRAATGGVGLNFNDRIAPKSSVGLSVNGTGYNMVIQDLIDEYERIDGTPAPVGQMIKSVAIAETRDKRLQATVLFPGATIGSFKFDTLVHSKHIYHSRKYLNLLDGVAPSDMPQNLNIIRYADVLLMAAEGLIEGGGSLTEALGYINEVRRKARTGLSPIVIGDANQMRSALRHERRVELAMEYLREYDIIRWKIAKQSLDKKFITKRLINEPAYLKAQKREFLGKVYTDAGGWKIGTDGNPIYLWPLPANEIIMNPKLLTTDNTNNGYR